MPSEDKTAQNAQPSAFSYAQAWGSTFPLPPPLLSNKLIPDPRIAPPAHHPRNLHNRAARATLPHAPHALPARPALQLVPQPIFLRDRFRRPDGRLVGPVPAAGEPEEGRGQLWHAPGEQVRREGVDEGSGDGGGRGERCGLWGYLCVWEEGR